jgi:hypothetical protein
LVINSFVFYLPHILYAQIPGVFMKTNLRVLIFFVAINLPSHCACAAAPINLSTLGWERVAAAKFTTSDQWLAWRQAGDDVRNDLTWSVRHLPKFSDWKLWCDSHPAAERADLTNRRRIFRDANLDLFPARKHKLARATAAAAAARLRAAAPAAAGSAVPGAASSSAAAPAPAPANLPASAPKPANQPGFYANHSMGCNLVLLATVGATVAYNWDTLKTYCKNKWQLLTAQPQPLATQPALVALSKEPTTA